MRKYVLNKTPIQNEIPITTPETPGPARADALYRGLLATRALLASSSPGSRVVSYKGGSLLVCPADPRAMVDRSEKPRGVRTACTGFSERSASALRCLLSTISISETPLFITLTYPESWPVEPKLWKRHLDAFSQALKRSHPHVSGIWKLEPQQRGAPHFHLILWGVDFLCPRFVGFLWWKVTGSGCVNHLKAGTSVERARSQRAVMAYAAKKYLCKTVEQPASWHGVGRFWGVINRRALPVSYKVEVPMGEQSTMRFRRTVRRFLERSGRAMPGGKAKLFTQAGKEWVRLAILLALEEPPRNDSGRFGRWVVSKAFRAFMKDPAPEAVSKPAFGVV